MTSDAIINSLQFPDKGSVAFDLDEFDNAIASHGLEFSHYRAMVDPVGLLDRYDTRRPGQSNPNSANGMVYTLAGKLIALCTNNTKEARHSNEGGMVDASTAQFTPSRTYLGTCKRVFLAPYDRLYLSESSVLVTRHELLECSPTGIDRPKFPPIEVLDCIDANGIRYTQDADFEVYDGKIAWKDRRPGTNPEFQKGTIYAIRYVYRPFWYVQRLIHEIRIVQQEDPLNGDRTTVQAPQSAIVQREYVFKDEADSVDSQRTQDLPQDGSLSPR